MKRTPPPTIPSEGPTMGSRVQGNGQETGLGEPTAREWEGSRGGWRDGSYMLLQLGQENAYSSPI